MAWCTCPIRCKGGREVADRTRAKHQKELRHRESERPVWEHIPDCATPPSNPSRKRHRSDDNGTHETCDQRAGKPKGTTGQEMRQNTVCKSVGRSFPAKINVTTRRLFDSTNSKPWTHQTIMEREKKTG